jgi:xanthine/uracil/vitamin C permease (AzgA family)
LEFGIRARIPNSEFQIPDSFVTAGIGLRERLITAIPASIKHAIAAGIGLLIAAIGLQWAGLIVAAPGTLVTLGNLRSRPVLLALGSRAVRAWRRADVTAASEVHPLIYACAVLFLGRYMFLR